MKNKFNEYYKQITRPGADELRLHLEEIGYFTAPASSNHHLAEDGGLLEHSLNVLDLLLKLQSVWPLKASVESLIIVALFHDLGKATFYGKPNYVENILKSGKRSDAKPYEVNKELLGIEHEIASLMILSKFINLTEEEAFAIRHHNGLYVPSGYALKGKETPLFLALHSADMWASRFLETKGGRQECLINMI